MDGVSNGDWIAVVSGIVIGVLAMVVAVGIALWQRVIQRGDGAALRASRRAAQQEMLRIEQDRQDRQARRDARRHQFTEAHTILKLGQSIEWHIRNHGPFSPAGLTDLKLDDFAMEAEQFASRGPERLRAPMLRLVTLAVRLQQLAVPETAEGGSTGNTAVVPVPATHVNYRQAIQQDRTAQELQAVLSAAWVALEEEWGS